MWYPLMGGLGHCWTGLGLGGRGPHLVIDLLWVMGCCWGLGTPASTPSSTPGAWLDLWPAYWCPLQASQLKEASWAPATGLRIWGWACGWVELGPGEHRIPGVWGQEAVRSQGRRACLSPASPAALRMAAAPPPLASACLAAYLARPPGRPARGHGDTRPRSRAHPAPATRGSATWPAAPGHGGPG